MGSREAVLAGVEHVTMGSPIKSTYDHLIKRFEEARADGQTALGPALYASILLAGRGEGNTVILCTDGLANLGLGSLLPLTEDSKKFYD